MPAAAIVSSGPTTTIVGGNAAQRSLLRAILAALGHIHLPLLRIVPVHGGVTLESPGLPIRFEWAALVAGTAFYDRSADQHLPRVLEVSVGQPGWTTGNAGPRPPRATTATIRAATRAMERLAHAAGARIEELSVSAPDALAVVLRLRVANAAGFLHDRLRTLVLSARADESRYDGQFFEVDDARGIAWADGETRLGGDSYVRPSLAGCNPFPSPGPARTIPPCPAD